MRYPLAVFAPRVGLRSETFVRRHVQELAPGATAVLSATGPGPQGEHWSAGGPHLVYDQIRVRSSGRLMLQGLLRSRTNLRDLVVEAFLERHGVEAILGEYLDATVRWVDLARRRGLRLFAHGHGYDVSRRLRQEQWRKGYLKYNDAAGVIVVAEHSRRRLIDLGIAPEKIHVIPCGVDVPSEAAPRPERSVVRCLAVGRMVAKKGPILLLDAFRRAAEGCPALRLDYVGEGELLPAARQYLLAFGLGDRVTLHGGQPPETVARFLREADLFLQHSLTDPDTGDEEGLPVAILEAMAAGLPVVATEHAGIPEAVTDGETGYLAAEGDTEGMAERLMALARDPALRRSMGRAGWRRAAEQFSWEEERRRLRELLGLERRTG